MKDETKKKNSLKKASIEKYVDFKLQYLHEIEDLVNMYYHEVQEGESCKQYILSPIDILAGLELIKLRFYCKVTTEGVDRRILMEGEKNEK
jgi:hypothetical protein